MLQPIFRNLHVSNNESFGMTNYSGSSSENAGYAGSPSHEQTDGQIIKL